MMQKGRAVLGLAAPHTWAASVIPVVFAGIYHITAYGGIRPGLWLMLLIICVLMQSAANAVNDWMDYRKGADRAGDCVEVMDSVLVHGLLSPGEGLAACALFLAVAGGMGLYVIYVSGIFPLLIGCCGGLVLLLYSLGPCPLSALPAGELASGITMGALIPLGVCAALGEGMRWDIIPLSVPLIIGTALLMMTNNTCDIEKDRAAGRKTAAVILGRSYMVKLYRILTVVWLLSMFWQAWRWGLKSTVVLAVVLTAAAGGSCRELLRAPLTQERRIEQMRDIQKANMGGGAAYCLALAVTLL